MFNRLLIPLDGSPLAEQALGQAAAIVRACGASVDLMLAHAAPAFENVRGVSWGAAEWTAAETVSRGAREGPRLRARAAP